MESRGPKGAGSIGVIGIVIGRIFVNELQSFRMVEWVEGDQWGQGGVERGNEGRGRGSRGV